MTKREQYLKALHNEPVDELVWVPNFDYWLTVNRAEGTLPEKYRDLSRNDIVRAIGGTIWHRATGLKQIRDSRIVERTRKEPDGRVIEELTTPLGTIRKVLSPTEGPHRAKATTEHFVKDLDSLRIQKYVVEGTHFEANYEPTLRALEETGNDGIVLNSNFCVPFIQFAKTDAGYEAGFLMWMDHRKEVDSLIQAWSTLFLEGYRLLAQGPADVIATGDNMDGFMISPSIFEEYAVPFYREAKAICAARGKLFEGHWCGRTQNLLPLVPGCGLDIVEAIVSKPMADITISEALDMLKGQVVLQGGLPSVIVCAECQSRAAFETYVREQILPLKGRRGFILGMSDNVPPNADFARVEAVAQLIR
jgi:hypothetical protein